MRSYLLDVHSVEPQPSTDEQDVPDLNDKWQDESTDDNRDRVATGVFVGIKHRGVVNSHCHADNDDAGDRQRKKVSLSVLLGLDEGHNARDDNPEHHREGKWEQVYTVVILSVRCDTSARLAHRLFVLAATSNELRGIGAGLALSLIRP